MWWKLERQQNSLCTSDVGGRGEESGGEWRRVEEGGGGWRKRGGEWGRVEQSRGGWRRVEKEGRRVEEEGRRLEEEGRKVALSSVHVTWTDVAGELGRY